MILVSACLVGIKCNYKRESRPNDFLIDLVKKGKAIPVCPEQLGGLPTPRSGARILSGKGEEVLVKKTRLKTDLGGDVTEEYLKGAKETLELAKRLNVEAVVLKQGSPSCGKEKTQGGEKERTLVSGDGVTTALCKKEGIIVFTEEELESKKEAILGPHLTINYFFNHFFKRVFLRPTESAELARIIIPFF